MKRDLFGTDGVRGTANTYPMTAETALRLAAAAGRYFRTDKTQGHKVVIGKDTRRSGYMIESALTAGFLSTGMDVVLLGPIPTPAVGMLTHSMRADVGVMVSASHNPHQDNGIKFLGPMAISFQTRQKQKLNLYFIAVLIFACLIILVVQTVLKAQQDVMLKRPKLLFLKAGG